MEYPGKGVVTASGQEPLTIYKSRDNAEGKNTREAVKFSFDKVSAARYKGIIIGLMRFFPGVPTGRRSKGGIRGDLNVSAVSVGRLQRKFCSSN